MSAIKTILHPTDFSEHSRCALALACSLARDQGARLIVLHVVPSLDTTLAAEMAAGHRPSEHFEEDMAGYRKEMQAQLDKLQSPVSGVKLERVFKEGPVAATIVRTAEELPCDLVVMGTHGKKGVEKALMGSVAEWVMRHGPCPVLTVRVPAGQEG
jgi:nucleotide-binding universal stress UspA family protein